MLSTMLKAKLHHARVTQSNKEYQGSLLLDPDLMELVKIAPYEKILVANVENGKRGETYALPGERGSGIVGVQGGMAHLADVGDRLIVFTFALVTEDEIASHRPLVAVLDENNKPVSPQE